MPRFRPKGKLDRSAQSDLWKHTLSRIPSVYGRLVYLASLRDTNSGTYRHHGLHATFGREEAVRALKESHQEVFEEWLNLSLAARCADLQGYLSALDEPTQMVVEHWLQSGVYRSYVPSTAMEAETELFCSDLDALLQIFKNGLGDVRIAPGSSRPA